MRLEKVVVAVDFSASSMAAARWTAEHLADEAEIVLTHCLELPSAPSLLWEELPPHEVLIPQIRRKTEERLASLVTELEADRDRQISSRILCGHPGEEIGKLVADEDANLVVAGKHGSHHGVWHILGSTAEQLVAACHRPVLLARGLPPDRLQNILVPVDESPPAASALGWAATLCRREEARLIAHHVVGEWYYHRVRELDGETQAHKIQDGIIAGARQWLEGFTEEHALGIPAVRHVDAGQAGFQTLAAVESFHADLIVVGSHGVKSMLGDPLARLSRFLIMAAPCSVLIVPEDGLAEVMPE